MGSSRARARRGSPLIPLTLIALILLVLALGGWLTVRFGTPPTTAQPAAAPPPASVEERVRSELPRLQEFVHRSRGLDFRRPVAAEVLADREFRAALRQAGPASAGVGSGATGGTLEALGLVGDIDRFDRTTREAAEADTLGFYDAAADRLVVRGSEWTPLLESTLVHELAHAVQDQHFPQAFDRPVEDGQELGFALTAVIEGDATAVEDDYYRHQSPNWQRRLDAQWDAAAEPASPSPARVRPARRPPSGDSRDLERALADSLAAAPYRVGADFITEVSAWGGSTARDRAFVDPPRTSEQLLAPQAWVDRAPWLEPQLVLQPDVPGRQVDSGVMGTLGLALLAAEGDLEAAYGDGSGAFDGWAGDRFVTTERPGRRCTDIDVVFDTGRQRSAAARALSDWDEERGTRLSLPRDRTLRLHSCS